jgi:hypothetical protein
LELGDEPVLYLRRIRLAKCSNVTIEGIAKMKKHLVVAILLMAASATAAPYLVCDIPPADQQIIGVRGLVDGTPFDTPYQLHSGAMLVYDAGTLSSAKHTFSNIRFYNIRGESDPVPFELPSVPARPSNISLRP